MALAFITTGGGAADEMAKLDDGTVMSVKDAKAAGYTIVRATSRGTTEAFASLKRGVGKTAGAHPFDSQLVVTRDNGIMRRSAAASLGYTLPPEGATAQAVTDARLDSFLDLPEARGKVRSAARLAKDNPEMTPDQARSFLRGAPTDAAITGQNTAARARGATPIATVPTADEAREARKAQLAKTMRGYLGRR